MISRIVSNVKWRQYGSVIRDISEGAKEETEVFQVQFRHVRLIVLGYFCAVICSLIVFSAEIIYSYIFSK